jgi:predicted alpha/beta hydrolase
MPAALDQLADRAPDTPLALLGHSAGGQLVGLMPEVDRLSRIAQVSSSTGYVGHIAGATRPLAWFMLEIYIPATCALLGYTPTQITGWGEDLPEGVARQWAEWCTEPGYVSNAFGRSIARHYYDEIRCPLLNLRCSDDPIATEANVDDLLRLFPGAEIERIVIRPEDYGLDEIGHIDLFRRRCRATWEPLLDWIFEDVDG